jgi:hypothetical protein
MLALFLCFGLLGGGFWLQAAHFRSQADKARQKRRDEDIRSFLAQVSNDQLLSISGGTLAHKPLSHVMRYVTYARQEDIDLLECYRRSLEHLDTRPGLAFILILDRNGGYFDHASENLDGVPWQEVLLWVALAEAPSRPELPEDVKKRLSALAAQSPTPPGVWYVARQYQKAGLKDKAVEICLRLLAAPSHEGISAARWLAQDAELRERAVEYFWTLSESPQADLARAAILELADVCGALKTQEYRAYSALDTPENARRLLAKLRQLAGRDAPPS